ncbi:hypothetical protein K2P47_03915 [Patescibacteria group bacterium]|nr:hypothetical protein [Patescibacteria group bacterium]
MTLKHQLTTLIPLAIIVAGLLGYNLMSAQWAGPTAVAPDNNTLAPINVGSNYQAKIGDLGAIRMRAGAYCNASGTSCFDPATINQQRTCPANQFVRGINTDGTLVCATATTTAPTNCTQQAVTAQACGGATPYCPAGYTATGPVYYGTRCSTNYEWALQNCIRVVCT